MVNAQEWLDKEYPLNKRKEMTMLNISNKNLEGSLKFKGFTNLRWLDCSNNQLTSLDISEFSHSIEFYCINNYLLDEESIDLKKLGNLTENDYEKFGWIAYDVYVESLALTAWKRDNISTFRQKEINRLEEIDNTLQLKITELQVQLTHEESKLKELEATFDQSPLERKDNLIQQIRDKEKEVINMLHHGKSTSSIRQEAENLKKQLPNYVDLAKLWKESDELINKSKVQSESVQSYSVAYYRHVGNTEGRMSEFPYDFGGHSFADLKKETLTSSKIGDLFWEIEHKQQKMQEICKEVEQIKKVLEDNYLLVKEKARHIQQSQIQISPK